jgi:regulatory protein YycH of two-component signal transduction system YycFG
MKNNIKNNIKNAAVFVLVIISLAQTGRLWFGVTANRGLFYAVSALVSNAPEDYAEKSYLANPYRIVSKTPDGYRIVYNNLSQNAAKQNADAALMELFSSGSYAGETDLNWLDILRENFVIYEYPVNISADVFAECFLQNAKAVKTGTPRLTENVKSISHIVFIPGGGEVTVLFLDGSRLKTYAYTVNPKKPVDENLSQYIEDTAGGGLSQTLYMSSAESRLTAPAYNVFIPDFPENGLSYRPLIAVNPYISPDGVMTLKSVEKGIEALFMDAPINQVTPDAISYRYANESVVVKYNLLTDVIEYSNYSSVNKQNNNGLVPNFSNAIRFIKNDPNIINDFYLDSYVFLDDAYTFRFNLAINGFPLLLPDSVKQETGMDYIMEITVQYQKVTNYKRAAYTFKADSEPYETATLTFDGFLATFYDPDADVALADILATARLGYKYDKNIPLSLNWMLGQGDKNYMRPAR